MPSLPRGLYEELITEALEARLQEVGAQLHTARSLPLGRLALSLHLGRVVKHALACLKDKDRVAEGITLARKILDLVDKAIPGVGARTVTPAKAGA
ncbi:MAG: hypothetical protein K1Y01_06685 [Vicinamibacteria bacterium]|nr:hypothetical protein [Vicinamibacteria bacterium]